MIQKRRLALLAAPVLLLTGLLLHFLTGNPEPDRILTIHSSEPILHIYAEYFNASQDNIRVRIVHSPNPSAYRNLSGPVPDIIIQKNPAGAYRKNWFAEMEMETPEGLYRQLKDIFLLDSGRTMLPLGFSLPLILWYGQQWAGDPPLTIGMHQLSEVNHLNHETIQNRRHLSGIGFSPLWGRHFPLWHMRSQQMDLYFSAQQTPAWDPDMIIKGVDSLRTWIAESGSTVDEIKRFMEGYMYAPYYALLRQGRIDYYPIDLREFQRLPGDLRQDLDFAWFGNQGRIPVLPSVVYAAIPVESRQRKSAEKFLSWISNPEVQRELIEYTISQGLPLFGFFEGLSANVKTNEQIIPHYFPEMYGKSPVASRLIFPPLLPSYWHELEAQVLVPTIRELIESPDDPDAGLLMRRIQSWIDARGDDE